MTDERLSLIARAGCGYCQELLEEIESLKKQIENLESWNALAREQLDLAKECVKRHTASPEEIIALFKKEWS